jgi:hypothetical protein
MAITSETIRFLAGARGPDEEIIAGGPAQSRELDRDFLAALESSNGGFNGVKRMAAANGMDFRRLMDAEWVATSRRFLYVRPHARSFNSWPWDTIAALEPVGVTYLGLFKKVRLSTTDGRKHHFSISRPATAALLQIANEWLAPRPEGR